MEYVCRGSGQPRRRKNRLPVSHAPRHAPVPVGGNRGGTPPAARHRQHRSEPRAGRRHGQGVARTARRGSRASANRPWPCSLPSGSRGLRTLYVSGEESPQQIKMRAGRLPGGDGECLVYAETLLEEIIRQAEAVRPDLMVIDSIQTIYSQVLESSPGSVSQIRECAAMLLKYAKTTGTSILLIGHITKDGTIAGPKVLEHIVDVVLQFEGDGNNVYRILRGIKNRFGATYEIGVFEMRNERARRGRQPVRNPAHPLRRTVERHRGRSSGRRHPPLPHRGAIARGQRRIRNAATLLHRIRHQAPQHAVGRAGEARRHENVPERRLPELRRRFQGSRHGGSTWPWYRQSSPPISTDRWLRAYAARAK